ncbi:YhbY family RNA-binding protein [Candidatus Pacearchaeota archaeon]|nr:YhbY family RNA-binding protein [Candidatus Pacearchaeota archaeon]
MSSIAKFQVGKSGITPSIVRTLNNLLEYHRIVRISVLRSSGRDRVSIREMAKKLLSSLDKTCKARIIGFTIVLIRQQNALK